MINILKKIFEQNEKNKENIEKDIELLCGLMIEAANSDGEIDNNEIKKITLVLKNSFEEDPAEISFYLNKAIENRHNSKSLFYYTSKINKNYSDQKKLILIETLWEIVLSDGRVHDYESSLIRRLSGLLYISDVAAGNARKRALNKISNKV